MSFFPVPGLYPIITAPGGGKTTLIQFELYKGAMSKSYDYAVVFTNTPSDYEHIIDSKYIRTQYTDKALAELLNFQKEQEEPGRMLLIFDDMVGAMNFNSPVVNMLVTQYRHYGIGVVIATQYCKKIPPTTRESCSRCFILGLNTKESFKACFESFGQSFSDLKVFQEYVRFNTMDHNFIVINNKSLDSAGGSEQPKNKFEVRKINVKTIPKNTRIEF